MLSQNSKLKVLFVGKKEDSFSIQASEFVKARFEQADIVFSRREESFPDSLNNWKGDLLISYLSQWIIPATLLKNTSFAAINFHPGPPEYPGIGCTNFAVYNNEKEFGITCHYMLDKVDTGKIIEVKRFAITNNDTVYNITQQCYEVILETFYKVMEELIETGKLPQSAEKWKRTPYTRKQLNELCTLTPQMSADEINRRIKATTFGKKVWAEVLTGETRIPYETAKQQGII